MKGHFYENILISLSESYKKEVEAISLGKGAKEKPSKALVELQKRFFFSVKFYLQVIEMVV